MGHERLPAEDHYFLTQKVPLLLRIARGQARAGIRYGVLDWSKARAAPELKLATLRGLAEGISSKDLPPDQDSANDQS